MGLAVIVAACLASGALIGFIGGVLGIGGGLLAIPLLGLVLGMSQQAAQGTALIMVLPAVLTTIRKYNQHARINWRAAASGASGSIAFTWVGAHIALGVDPITLRRTYAVFVLAIAFFYFYQSRPANRRKKRPVTYREAPDFHSAWYTLVGVFAGLIGGVFGVGGSIMAVPVLTTFFRYTQTGAQGLALTMIIPGTLVALFTYATHGQADWIVGIPLALGSIFLVPYGVKFAYALPEPRLKRIFAIMLLVITFLLLIKA